MSKVATRFAPSPTGALHIGGVRTALFNWLYSKNQKGTFHLRIEDTDKERSKEEHRIQIINSLKWIGIEHDGDEYIQSNKVEDHIKVANELLKNGSAYKCYCSSEEIEEQKKRAKQKKIPYVYDRKWRDKNESEAPNNIKPVIRFKSKVTGKSVLKDLVQGDVEIENKTIEDLCCKLNGSKKFEIKMNGPNVLSFAISEVLPVIKEILNNDKKTILFCHQAGKIVIDEIKNNLNDTIGSDHAPHLKVNKDKEYPNSPSGMPGVQTLMPVMLDHVNHGKLSLTQLINLVCENPIKIFGIQNKGFIKEGYDADFTIVDMNKKITIKNENIESKCGWSPFNDVEFKGTPVATIISGKIKMRDGKILGDPEGTPLKFS